MVLEVIKLLTQIRKWDHKATGHKLLLHQSIFRVAIMYKKNYTANPAGIPKPLLQGYL